jgi:hypothetical protein
MRILYNGKIHTQDPQFPLVSAIAIEAGRIIAAGDSQQIKESFPLAESLSDLGGATVIPGLTDAHIHLENYALSLRKIDCDGLLKAQCLQKVAEQVKQSPPGAWILGHGWNQNDWEDGFGTAADLDKIAPANPVFLTAKSLHSAWVNSQALELAGVEAGTAISPGGSIARDPHGHPTGILFENAIALVSSAIPDPSLDEVIASILEAQKRLLEMGITSVHDFDRARCFTALQTLQRRGKLSLRVTKSIPLESLPEAVDLGLQTGFGNDWLRIGGVKVFTDGALGPHTAAMLQPYEDDPSNRGMLFMDREELFQQGLVAASHGLSLAIHAIGDRANQETLAALERLRDWEAAASLSPRLRHRIEHVQVLHPQDVPRLAASGIIASMQPIHAVSDMFMAGRYWGARAAKAYAWKSQLDHGAVLAFGSDAPVESPNPFWGIHAAVTRRRQDGAPGPEGWFPEQRLTLEEALHGFTTGPAYASGMENRLGKLSPGFLADLLVLDRDVYRCHPDEIHRVRPLRTMIGGEWVAGDF